MTSAKAFGFGLFYVSAGAWRTIRWVNAVSRLSGLPNRAVSDVIGISPAWGPSGIALFAFADVVVAPFAEEYLYRGVLLPWLTTWMNRSAAMAWCALAFGAVHLYYGAGAAVTVVGGLVMAWARLETGKLRASVALHMAWNAVTIAAFVLPSAGPG
ncbi:MAG TPA: CPBP family intramembrane glutamic endopeptidase [Polyangiaceae bacterium]|nr:CPBP family intramembrane glutamic endopeptidase [Polyangiaceae bacterium]